MRCARNGRSFFASSDSDCIFLTWEWLYTWWKHLAEDRSLAILAVRRGGELIALQPCCLRPRSILRRPSPPDDRISRERVRRAQTILTSL